MESICATTFDLLSSALMVFQQKPNSGVSVTIFSFVMRACELSSLATQRLFISLLHLLGISELTDVLCL